MYVVDQLYARCYFTETFENPCDKYYCMIIKGNCS